MAKTIYLHFSTDEWHTAASKDLICAATTRKTGLKHVKAYIVKNRLKPLDQDEIDDMERINQTQGRDCNFFIEPVELNQPLF